MFTSGGRFVLEFHGVARHHYHGISPEAQLDFTVVHLTSVLLWLKARFSILTPDEFLRTNKSGVLLTFDDGLANNCTNILPVLTKLEVPATLFVSTQHIKNPKNWLS